MSCRFFGSSKGCRAGDQCRFVHDSSVAKRGERKGRDLGPTRFLADSLNEARDGLRAAGHALDVIYRCRDRLPSALDERAMAAHLVLSSEERGRGVNLPAERRLFIELRAAELNFDIIGAFSYRRQLIRQMVGSTRFYQEENAMGSNQQAQAHATKVEDCLEAWLRDNDIQFIRQDLLVQMGLKATPDFYIQDDLRINGKEVRWIDCKTYYGSRVLADDRTLPIGNLYKQKRLYNELFGSGCLLFLCGFCGDLQHHTDFTDVLLLDGNQMDKELLYREDQATVDGLLGLKGSGEVQLPSYR